MGQPTRLYLGQPSVLSSLHFDYLLTGSRRDERYLQAHDTDDCDDDCDDDATNSFDYFPTTSPAAAAAAAIDPRDSMVSVVMSHSSSLVLPS